MGGFYMEPRLELTVAEVELVSKWFEAGSKEDVKVFNKLTQFLEWPLKDGRKSHQRL